jgi:hypothetical protein
MWCAIACTWLITLSSISTCGIEAEYLSGILHDPSWRHGGLLLPLMAYAFPSQGLHKQDIQLRGSLEYAEHNVAVAMSRRRGRFHNLKLTSPALSVLQRLFEEVSAAAGGMACASTQTILSLWRRPMQVGGMGRLVASEYGAPVQQTDGPTSVTGTQEAVNASTAAATAANYKVSPPPLLARSDSTSALATSSASAKSNSRFSLTMRNAPSALHAALHAALQEPARKFHEDYLIILYGNVKTWSAYVNAEYLWLFSTLRGRRDRQQSGT